MPSSDSAAVTDTSAHVDSSSNTVTSSSKADSGSYLFLVTLNNASDYRVMDYPTNGLLDSHANGQTD